VAAGLGRANALVDREPPSAAFDIEVEVVSMGAIVVGRQNVLKGAKASEFTDQVAEQNSFWAEALGGRSGAANRRPHGSLEVALNFELGAIVQEEAGNVRSQSIGVLAALFAVDARTAAIKVIDHNALYVVSAKHWSDVVPEKNEAAIGHAKRRRRRARLQQDATDGADNADRCRHSTHGAREANGKPEALQFALAGDGRKIGKLSSWAPKADFGLGNRLLKGQGAKAWRKQERQRHR
jgi:hypothetical protein